MSYLVKCTEKVFSRSSDRMIEENRYYEYERHDDAEAVAANLKQKPMTVSVKIFKEE